MTDEHKEYFELVESDDVERVVSDDNEDAETGESGEKIVNCDNGWFCCKISCGAEEEDAEDNDETNDEEEEEPENDGGDEDNDDDDAEDDDDEDDEDDVETAGKVIRVLDANTDMRVNEGLALMGVKRDTVVIGNSEERGEIRPEVPRLVELGGR